MPHSAPRHPPGPPGPQGPPGPGRRDRLAAGPDVLFVYGTLRFPGILAALLGRVPAGGPATVTGWRAAALERRAYPGLVPAGEAAVPGLLLEGLTRAEWRVLDDFEDDRYELRRLPLADGRYGWAYVWTAGEVRAENWSAEVFGARHLAAYTARCAALAAGRDTSAR